MVACGHYISRPGRPNRGRRRSDVALTGPGPRPAGELRAARAHEILGTVHGGRSSCGQIVSASHPGPPPRAGGGDWRGELQIQASERVLEILDPSGRRHITRTDEFPLTVWPTGWRRRGGWRR